MTAEAEERALPTAFRPLLPARLRSFDHIGEVNVD
jgi:hypothetical protein